MNNTNPIVSENVRVWRQTHGKPDLEAIAEHEAQLAEETASREERLAKVRRCSTKCQIPPNAVDVVFRRGADGRGGRLHWTFKLDPTSETLVLV